MPMKNLLALATAASLLALPPAAEAGPAPSVIHTSGHAACGCALHTKRIVVGYDNCRRPVYRYIALPVTHHCGHGHRSILRTSSCSPHGVSRVHTWTLGSHGHVHWSSRSHCHSRPIIRIRTSCR